MSDIPVPRARKRWHTVAFAMLLVAALAAMGWKVSDFARTNWWQSQPHVAVGVGTALDDITVTSVDVEEAPPISDWDGEWQPPNGFELWQVELGIETTNTEAISGEVYLEDSRGRIFPAALNTPYPQGYESSATLTAPGPTDKRLPKVQKFLVLAPQDAAPVAVRIESAFSLNPHYFRLVL